MSKLIDLMAKNKLTLIVSLPENSAGLAKAAIEGGADALKVHKDIRAVSGATISSEATCFAVRKATVLCEELVAGSDKLATVK